MDITLECLYCGYQWKDFVYSFSSLDDKKCSICGDANLKQLVAAETSDVFGYNHTDPRQDAYFKRKKT
jgi:hypothetical protein